MPHPHGGYRDEKGKRVPGVTTITGRFKDSSGLLYWAFEQGKAAERGEISKLYEKRDEAADAGTVAHAMVEAHISDDGRTWREILRQNKQLPPKGKILTLAKQGYENYLKWVSDSRIRIIHQEEELVSERYKFGGCPDAIGIDSQGNKCLIDWKTSNSVYPEHLIQIAAYRVLWEENHPDELITGGFHLLRFSKEHADFTHHYWGELEDAWAQFELFRKAYDLDRKLKKRL